jgi:hypothetical protein
METETTTTPPPVPGWYPTVEGSVDYWNGAAWVGKPRRVNSAGRRPRDRFGAVALSLVGGGLAVQVLSVLLIGARVLMLAGDAGPLLMVGGLGPVAILAGFVVGVIGFIDGRRSKFPTPLSLAAWVSALVLFVLALLAVIALFAFLATTRI